MKDEKQRYNINKQLNQKEVDKRIKNAHDRDMSELFYLSMAINERLITLEINQNILADRTGIAKATISAYCNAESMPNGANLLKLANELDTTPDYLLGYIDTPARDIDVQSIHEKTGLSELAIANLFRFTPNIKNNTKETQAKILSDILSDEAFYTLLSEIEKYYDFAIDKEAFEESDYMQEIQADLGVASIFTRFFSKHIVLNPYQRYEYLKIRLSNLFMNIIERHIEKHLESESVQESIQEKLNSIKQHYKDDERSK